MTRSLDYSARNAAFGSTRAARMAGIAVAATATRSNAPATAPTPSQDSHGVAGYALASTSWMAPTIRSNSSRSAASCRCPAAVSV